MNLTEIIENLLIFIAGTGVFITGLKMMSRSLEQRGGAYLQRLFSKVKSSSLSGVGIGVGATVLTQSSSATTVMLVGFANAGIIETCQSISIVMGANIGTTLTTQIIALSEIAGTLNALFCALTFVGAIMCLTAGDNGSYIGSFICGFGLIFTGLYVSSASIETFSNLTLVQNVFKNYDMPFIMFLSGLIVTMIVQSSAVTTGMLLGFIGAGLMEVTPALYAIMGANIGTCITAFLASIGADIQGKKVAFIHLAFNVFGAIVFSILFCFFPISKWLCVLLPDMEYQQIAVFHTVFNVVITLLLLPFVKEIAESIDKIFNSRVIKRNKRRQAE